MTGRAVRSLVWVLLAVPGGCGLDWDRFRGGDAGASATDSGLLDAGGCVADRSDDYCISLPTIEATPGIDGRIDCALRLQDLGFEGWTGEVPDDLSASIAFAWTAEGLYAFVSVRQPGHLAALDGEPVYCGDSVHLHVDADGEFPNEPEYDDPGARHFTIAAPATDDESVARGEVQMGKASVAEPWGSLLFGAFPTEQGYDVEAFVVADDLGLPSWPLGEGGSVGVDVAINVAEPGAKGECSALVRQFIFHTGGTGCGVPYCDVGAFCRAHLAP